MPVAVEVHALRPDARAARRDATRLLRARAVGVAIVVTSVAAVVALQYALAPLLGGRSPFLGLVPAVVISAWWGGPAAGAIALALTAVAGLVLPGPADGPQMLLYLTVGGALAMMTEGARSARARLARHVRLLADTHRRDQRELASIDDRIRRLEGERDRLRSAERRARADADAAGRAKDEFLAIVSHELRTPLNAVLGWASLLGRDLPVEKRARAVEAIQRSARAQAQLIEDLLDTSRMQAGKLTLDRRLTPIAPSVRAALEVVAPEAVRKGVALAASGIELEPERAVLGDAHRIQQIVTNLLTNAVKFTPAGGRVELELRASDAAIELEVRDDGEGIDAAALPHVFDRFRPSDGGATKRHGGLGLGLSIVRHLVAEHGGSVEARSEGKGRGATFVVRLPCAPAAMGTTRAVAQPVPTAHALDGLKVLVVDDDGDGREVLGESLARAGAAVRTAPSVDHAWRTISEGTWIPDVLVSDLAMPEVDGVELIRRVRTLTPAAVGSVPALAVSAHARRADRSRATDAGFDRHLSKPVDPDELVRAVAELAGRGAARTSAPT